MKFGALAAIHHQGALAADLLCRRALRDRNPFTRDGVALPDRAPPGVERALGQLLVAAERPEEPLAARGRKC
jgi:hypothetical protein